jgi:hypothetical protein
VEGARLQEVELIALADVVARAQSAVREGGGKLAT